MPRSDFIESSFDFKDANSTPKRQLHTTLKECYATTASPQSPLYSHKAQSLLNQLHAKQRKQLRKYSVDNLYAIRHCFRDMPLNIKVIPNVLSQGLGLKVNAMSPSSKQRNSRKKQIEMGKNTQGYFNYITLIPKFSVFFYFFSVFLFRW